MSKAVTNWWESTFENTLYREAHVRFLESISVNCHRDEPTGPFREWYVETTEGGYIGHEHSRHEAGLLHASEDYPSGEAVLAVYESWVGRFAARGEIVAESREWFRERLTPPYPGSPDPTTFWDQVREDGAYRVATIKYPGRSGEDGVIGAHDSKRLRPGWSLVTNVGRKDHLDYFAKPGISADYPTAETVLRRYDEWAASYAEAVEKVKATLPYYQARLVPPYKVSRQVERQVWRAFDAAGKETNNG